MLKQAPRVVVRLALCTAFLLAGNLFLNGCSRSTADANAAARAALPESTRALLERYEKVRAALADDKMSDAKFQAGQLASEARFRANQADAPAPVRDLAAAAETMAAGDSAVQLRDNFKAVSAAAIQLAAGAQGFYTINCPMTPKGDWLQTNMQISNPYFGRSMRDCGVVKR